MKAWHNKHSILTRFAIISVLALTLAFVISFVLLHNYNVWSMRNEGMYSIDYAKEELEKSLSETSYSELFSSKTDPGYLQFRTAMREVCDSCEADNLYLYTVNKEHTQRTYLFAVTTDPEREAALVESRNLGDVSTEPLSEDELRVLDGATMTEPEIVSNGYGNDLCLYRRIELPDSKGYAILGLDYDVNFVDSLADADTLAFAIPIMIAVFGIAGVELLLLKFYIVSPIRKVAASMREFAQEGQAPKEPLKAKREDEIGEIITSFNQMTSDIERYVVDIEEMTEERVAANTELQVARRIQQSLVPAEVREEGDGYDAYAFSRTAREVGGDFYDLAVLDDGRLLAVIADVSGKGVSAALYMSMCLTLLHSKLQELKDPAAALNEANDVIESNNSENMFVTVLVGIFDQNTGVLTYANAGHTPPLLSDGTYLDPDPGIAIGLFEDAGIVNQTVELKPGTGVLLYTDGAVEANDSDKQFFGEERLAAAVVGSTSAKAMVHAAVDAVDSFVGNAEQFDDLTMLALFAKERDAQRWEVELAPELACFDTLREQLQLLCDDKDVQSRAILACDEAFANIANYSKATSVSVEIVRTEEQLTVRMSDDGTPFDPLSNKPEDKDFEDLEFGGMGIKFIKQSGDKVRYEYADNRNVLTMSFIQS